MDYFSLINQKPCRVYLFGIKTWEKQRHTVTAAHKGVYNMDLNLHVTAYECLPALITLAHFCLSLTLYNITGPYLLAPYGYLHSS